MRKDAGKLGLKEMLELFKHGDYRGLDGVDAVTGEFSDNRTVEDDVGEMMRSMASLRSKPKRAESEVFGRRW
jgi:hypothetical protein